jgi:hypothetical protein
MSIPLDDDWNKVPPVTVDAIPTHGAHSQPRAARGGAFAPADIPLIKEALYALRDKLSEDDDRLTHISLLIHRLGRIV